MLRKELTRAQLLVTTAEDNYIIINMAYANETNNEKTYTVIVAMTGYTGRVNSSTLSWLVRSFSVVCKQITQSALHLDTESQCFYETFNHALFCARRHTETSTTVNSHVFIHTTVEFQQHGVNEITQNKHPVIMPLRCKQR